MVRVRDMALDLTHQVMAVHTVTVHTVKAALLLRTAVDPRRAAAKESTAGPAAAAVAKAMAAAKEATAARAAAGAMAAAKEATAARAAAGVMAAAKVATAARAAAAAVAKAMAAEIARIRAKVTAKAAEKTEAKIVHACPESVFAAQGFAVTFAESPCFSHVRGLRPLA
jgi:hypothetical protein